MPAAVARVGTNVPRRYMTQLCKHFEHRLAVSYDDTQGSIAFQAGLCRLAVEPDALVMTVEAADEAALPQLQDVVARHLLRFAFREPPEIVWVGAPNGPEFDRKTADTTAGAASSDPPDDHTLTNDRPEPKS